MAATVVTLPPSLVFLATNIHSFVNIKLDSTNYLLWRIQVENIMQANDFLGYLDGPIECPPSQIRTLVAGTLAVNPIFTLWKLIDVQLLSCLTASLSPTTLPYILGLHHASEVWESLSNRYNTLLKSNVQDPKSKLYNVTKTSTIECYVDSIKEYTHKLAAFGSPVGDDDLIFHTLKGLPKVFNSFRTMVKGFQTRGDSITLNDVVNMLSGENIQLLEENFKEVETGFVMVATGVHQLGKGKLVDSTSMNQSSVSPSLHLVFGQLGVSNSPLTSQFQTASGQFTAQSAQQFMPSQYVQPMAPQAPQIYQSQFRGFGRGKGRGPFTL